MQNAAAPMLDETSFNRLVELVSRPYVDHVRRELREILADPRLLDTYPHYTPDGRPVEAQTSVSRRIDLPEPDALLTRAQAAAALTAAGHPIAVATLKTLASRGGGPAFQKAGSRVVYVWSTTFAWAQSKLGPVQRSTSENDAPKARSPRSIAASTEATA
jgi:hypothetical protein